MAAYPAKDVASWLGNSVPVAMAHHAMAHYAMATAESFQRAVIEGAAGGKSGAICGSIPMGTETIPSQNEERKNPGFQGENRVEMAGCGCGTGAKMGEEGLEPPTSTL
jgi:hypothetical protein